MRTMTAKEFRESGFMQEVNRRVLHPVGVSLQTVQQKDGSEILAIIDAAEEQHGLFYHPTELKKALRSAVNALAKARLPFRRAFGIVDEYGVQQIGESLSSCRECAGAGMRMDGSVCGCPEGKKVSDRITEAQRKITEQP